MKKTLTSNQLVEELMKGHTVTSETGEQYFYDDNANLSSPFRYRYSHRKKHKDISYPIEPLLWSFFNGVEIYKVEK